MGCLNVIPIFATTLCSEHVSHQTSIAHATPENVLIDISVHVNFIMTTITYPIHSLQNCP
jgi:hypothetical protein